MKKISALPSYEPRSSCQLCYRLVHQREESDRFKLEIVKDLDADIGPVLAWLNFRKVTHEKLGLQHVPVVEGEDRRFAVVASLAIFHLEGKKRHHR